MDKGQGLLALLTLVQIVSLAHISCPIYGQLLHTIKIGIFSSLVHVSNLYTREDNDMKELQTRDTWLHCPNCKGDYLHQVEVIAYWCAEDEKTGLKAVSSMDRCFVETSMKGNPSARRQGLTIRFECEACSAEPLLAITQHKGQTEIGWWEPEEYEHDKSYTLTLIRTKPT
jgi:hypothetical protein